MPIAPERLRELPSQPEGVTLIRLRDTHGLTTREKGMLRQNIVTDDLREEWKPRQIFGEKVLATGERLQELAHHRPLRFAEVPDGLTVRELKRSPDLRPLAVPVLTEASLREIMNNPDSPLREVYTEGYLKRVEAGEIELSKGNYVFIDGEGAQTKLSRSLGLGDLSSVSVEDLDVIRRTIIQNEKKVLKKRRLNGKGAYIDIASAEEMMLSTALGNKIEGLTSTRLGGEPDQLAAITDGEIHPTGDAKFPIRLVIRFGERNFQLSDLSKPQESVNSEPFKESALDKLVIPEGFRRRGLVTDELSDGDLENVTASADNPLVRRKANDILEGRNRPNPTRLRRELASTSA